jgi:hypothetical protein
MRRIQLFADRDPGKLSLRVNSFLATLAAEVQTAAAITTTAAVGPDGQVLILATISFALAPAAQPWKEVTTA